MERKIYEGPLAEYWFDKNGILNAASKDIPRTLELLKQSFDFIKEITNNKKVCLISDNFSTKACSIDIIKYSLQEYPKVYKAVAIVPRSPIGKVQGSILTNLNPPDSIPVNMFQDYRLAKEWLTQYL